MRKSVTALATAAALTAAPLLAATAMAAPASTQLHKAVLTDPTGDVWKNGTQQVSRSGADVIRAKVFHGTYNLQITMRFVDLKKVNPQKYLIKEVAGAGDHQVIITAGPRHWAGTVVLKSPTGEPIPAPGLTHEINYATNVVTVSIPRKLLDKPAALRVQLSNVMTDHHGTFADNPMNTSATPDGDFTPRLFMYPAS